MQYVEKVFQGNKELHIEDKDFPIPDSFQSIYSNEKAMRWLSKIIVGSLGLGVEQILNMM